MKSVSGFWSLLSLWQVDGRVVLGMSSGNELLGGGLLSLLYRDHYHVNVCQCFELSCRSALNHKCLSQMSVRKNGDANANAKGLLNFTAKWLAVMLVTFLGVSLI